MAAAQLRRLAAAFAAAGTVLGAAACSSADDLAQGGGALSYDRVRSVALDAVRNRTDTCPFGLDFAKAAGSAGITGAVSRLAVNGEGDLIMMLSQDSGDPEQNPALAGEPLRKAAEALVKQLG
ncbi:hypothetical protein VM98_08295 [Streptomyces rubellomurinus subsp. indigoferus]|nr:hypothetical protein VM98_08295 [Streptomyces rubellomurinus subsp. indigoferus]